MIIAPRRSEEITSGGVPSTRYAAFLEGLETTVNALIADTDAYTVTNVTTDRIFDANQAAGDITASPTQAEVENIRDSVLKLADIVGTLVADLKGKEVVT